MKFIVFLPVLVVEILAAKTTRIIGGEDAHSGQFPYQVSLQLVRLFIFSEHICGGSIIAPQWILTAGHCIIDPGFFSWLSIKAGLLHLIDNVNSNQIEKTIIHPDYKGGVNPNDIALIKLTESLKFSLLIKPINLPSKNQRYSRNAVLSGWGYTTNGNAVPAPTLQTAILPLLSYRECENALKAVQGTSKPLAKGNICTGPLTGERSACNGDSGGPLVQNNVIIGIVSWGLKPCASIGAPGVYTEAKYFLDFIKNNMN